MIRRYNNGREKSLSSSSATIIMSSSYYYYYYYYYYFVIVVVILIGLLSSSSTSTTGANTNNGSIIFVSANSIRNNPDGRDFVPVVGDNTIIINNNDQDKDDDTIRSTVVSLLRTKKNHQQQQQQQQQYHHRPTPTNTASYEDNEDIDKYKEDIKVDDKESELVIDDFEEEFEEVVVEVVEEEKVEEEEETYYESEFQNITQEERRTLTLGTTYSLIAASKVATTLRRFQLLYPRLIRVNTTQKVFGLPTAYTDANNDCPYDQNVKGCLNYYAIIQDYVVHPIGSDSSNALPTILLSGELHGDERVGPTAVIEATKLLLNASLCETYKVSSAASKQCRLYLRLTYGINDDQRRWLARLVTTRRIIIVPTANALGYYQNVREEGWYDPNRDFPYDLLDDDCMNTIAARTLNELFRTNIVQMSLTFHGGMETIAYEWGATTWFGYYSPDDIGQNRLCTSMQQYAGKFGTTPFYPIGPSNDLVYDIRGGMEDWAYAGSWDPTRVPKCNPSTYGGYPKSKTTYGPADLRDFNILVETSNDKIPPSSLLGTNYQILNPTSTGNGHVPRNIRVSLLTAELVEPYITFCAVNGIARTIDIVPLKNRKGKACSNGSNVVKVKYSSTKPTITIDWIVGGALEIDNTKLWYAKWSTVPTLNCLSQPSTSITKSMTAGTMLTTNKGLGRYTSNEKGGTIFRASINIKNYKVGDKIVILVETSVDSSWKNTVPNTAPKVPPQSHMVNVRTNSSWYYKNSVGHIVQGRTRWFSIPPLTIKLI